MITFLCHCKHRFTVEDNLSGEDIQCPKCGLLNTVPAAGDLGLLDDDGLYHVEGETGPEREHPEVAAKLSRIYRPSRVDEFGQEIDLRSHATPLDYQRVDVDPMDAPREKPLPPKYDPETGELIRPMEVEKVQPAVRAALPAARPNRRRVAVERLERVAPFRIFAELFKAPNLIVMGIVLFVHLLYMFLVALPLMGIILFFVGFVLMLVFLAAHYGNVVDETGPSSSDELPRPLRNLGWEDTWGPFRAFILTMLVCYGPTAAFLWFSMGPWPFRLIGAVTWAILGTIIAPAVILITTTSGSIFNLRPDRIFGTIRACGAIYPLLLVEYIVVVPLYVIGYLESTMAGINGDLSGFGIREQWYITIPMLAAGMFLMHHFMWTLGHVYRVHHSAFPWVFQGALRDLDSHQPRGFQVIPQPPRKTTNPSPPLTAIPVEDEAKDRS